MLRRAFASFLAFLIALNLWGWHVTALGLALGLMWLTLASWLIGGRLGQLADSRGSRLAWGLLTSLAAVSILGTVLFYLNLFNTYTLSALAVLLPWFGTTATGPAPTNTTEPASGNRLATLSLTLTYLGLALTTLLVLAASQTAEAIRTPWAVAPAGVIALYGLAAFTLVWLTRYLKHPLWLVPFYLLCFSVLVLVYPLGYGFDTFIHQASEKLLAATGSISPKPLYYLGQYSLTVFLTQTLNVSLEQVDTWLVPALASLALPLTSVRLAIALKLSRPWRLGLGLVPLAFALSNFTYTTPQGLSYLWALLTLLTIAAQRCGAAVPRPLPWLFGLAALACHPLTGLPVVGVLTLWWLKDFGAQLKRPRLTWWLTAAGTALAVPLAFIIMSWLKPGAASLAFSPDLMQNLRRLWQHVAEQLPFLPRFIDVPDALYLWGRPLTLALVLLAAVGTWAAWHRWRGLLFLGQAAALPLISYLLLALFASFPNLPPNEQDFYTVRLWELGLLALWPLALVGTYQVGSWAMARLKPVAWVTAASLILTAGFYLTYPRLDVWHRDAAYNTTPYDIEAIKLVEAEADGSPYVVLANQAVAAAAVREYGFAHYYDGYFYYPLPTGTNPLYQVYLNATERGLPMRDIVSRAAIGGVGQVFLVLNRYWADYDTLHATAAAEADAWWSVAQGRLTVYRYDF